MFISSFIQALSFYETKKPGVKSSQLNTILTLSVLKLYYIKAFVCSKHVMRSGRT